MCIVYSNAQVEILDNYRNNFMNFRDNFKCNVFLTVCNGNKYTEILIQFSWTRENHVCSAFMKFRAGF